MCYVFGIRWVTYLLVTITFRPPTHRVVGVAAKRVNVGLQVVRLVLVRHHEQDHKLLVDVLRTHAQGDVLFAHTCFRL